MRKRVQGSAVILCSRLLTWSCRSFNKFPVYRDLWGSCSVPCYHLTHLVQFLKKRIVQDGNVWIVQNGDVILLISNVATIDVCVAKQDKLGAVHKIVASVICWTFPSLLGCIKQFGKLFFSAVLWWRETMDINISPIVWDLNICNRHPQDLWTSTWSMKTYCCLLVTFLWHCMATVSSEVNSRYGWGAHLEVSGTQR